MYNSSDIHSNSIFPAEYPVQYDSTFVNISLNFAAVALVFYEYIITLQDEVAYFWGRRFTGASLLFYSNRYLVLAYSGALLHGTAFFTRLAKVVPPSNLVWKPLFLGDSSSCSRWSNSVRAMEILSYVPWAGLSSLRVYALSGGALSLAVPVLILSLVPVCINFVVRFYLGHAFGLLTSDFRVVSAVNNVAVPVPDDHLTYYRTVTIISRISLIVADLVVIMTTWTCTYGVITTLGGQRATISGVLLYNGTLCFVTLLLLNVLHLAFCASSVFPSFPGNHISDVVVFLEPITSILTSRFMLSLQAVSNRTSARSESDLPANVTSLSFEKVVGSLAVTRSSSFSSYVDDNDEDGEITEGGNPWRADEVVAAPRKGSWENPFADVEAAGTASLTSSDVSVRTVSSIVFY